MFSVLIEKVGIKLLGDWIVKVLKWFHSHSLISFFLSILISIFLFSLYFFKTNYILKNFFVLIPPIYNFDNSVTLQISELFFSRFANIIPPIFEFIIKYEYKYRILEIPIYISALLILFLWVFFLYKKVKNSNDKKIITTYQIMLTLIHVTLTIAIFGVYSEASKKDFMYFNEMHRPYSDIKKGSLIVNEHTISKMMIAEIETNSSKEIKKVLSKNPIGGLFISPRFINNLKKNLKVEDQSVTDYLTNLKKKYNLKYYTDMEDYFPGLEKWLPRQISLATSDEYDEIYNITRQYAKELKDKFLIDYVFGPVLDRKLSASDNTVLTRTFGTDPTLIYLCASSMILGFQSEGIECIPKHFPGHPQLEKIGTNPHYNLITTQYSDEMLKSNSQPFSLIGKNKFLKVNKFMTDHIIIPSITTKKPYTIFKNIDGCSGGVTSTAKKFLNTENFSFVSDDIKMLTRINNKNIVSNKSETSMISNFCIDAIVAGHSYVLVRGLKPLTLTRVVDAVRENFDIINTEKTTDKISKAINSTGVDQKEIIPIQHKEKLNFNGYLKINSVNKELDHLKLAQLQQKKLLVISSCWASNDFTTLFEEKDKSAFYNFSRKSRNFEEQIKKLISKIKSKELNLEGFDFVIIGTDAIEMNNLIATIYEQLEKIEKEKNLMIFLLGSPDALYQTHKNYLKKIKIVDIYAKANIYAVFSNTKENLLNLKLLLGEDGFSVFKPLSKLTIDLPDFYYFNYHSAKKIKFVDQNIKKAVIGSEASNLIMEYQKIVFMLHISFFVFSLLCLKIIAQSKTMSLIWKFFNIEIMSFKK